MKCQGQACNLEVQICWGVTWKPVLDTDILGGVIWKLVLDTDLVAKFNLRSGSLRWSLNPKDLVSHRASLSLVTRRPNHGAS